MFFLHFTPEIRNSLSTNTLSKKAKDKTPNKRRSSKKVSV